MGRWLRPDAEVDSIYAIDPAALRARGIRGVILDLDNTMVPWGAWDVPAALGPWIAAARAVDLRLCIVSNNAGARVAHLAEALELPAVTGAWKPRRGALRRALRMMGTAPDATALVGDQVFTDVLGGNRLGLHTILVHPQSGREFPLTRLTRLAERVAVGLRRRRLHGGRPRA
ncbi:MAG TPA: YqeG family HAD IIIA-type phosphatase [bacterium]|nr:YqeG family HAD IIIA-type phosphatase [bacterium]